MLIEETQVFARRRARGGPTPGFPEIVICCSACRRVEAMRTPGRPQAEAAANHFRARGWWVDAHGRKAMCRECQVATKATAKAANGQAQSAQAMRSQAAAIRLLDDHFDTVAGRYDGGWSDAAVAKEVGLSIEAITTLRELVYGPLLDPTIAKLEGELAALEQRLKDDLQEHEDLLAATKRELGQAIAALRLQLDNATKGHKRANGAA